MKELFLIEAAKNKALPIGGGLWSTALFHPEDAPASPLTEWTFDFPITRMPESAAPKLGKDSSLVTMDVDVPANANGVLYALAGFSGGITTYVKDGFLNYEFNLFEVAAHQDRGPRTSSPPGKANDRASNPKLAGRDRRADGRRAEGERRRGGRRAACRPRCRSTSRRMRPSTSASIWIRRCRSTTTTRRRSRSTAPSARTNRYTT